ncbi:MAG: acetylornithine deacetylase [Marinobacter sp.]|uniref:acetylornithine deacetylase n=1 Tax=Marinobacter sp. TaxID=50741 RepID=UPI00299F1DC7|nr:acetylornithine deacetylase [Marinobacter sp.]MDX1756395.1 acetylornithine deacetylase [Marinobacter sp.]
MLTTVLVLALLGFAGFKATVWWLVDRDLRQAQLAMDELGVIERGSIHSSIAGRVTLQEAAYQDFRLTQPLTVAKLTFDAGSPLTLLGFLADPVTLPGQWQAIATGWRLGLDASMFRSWVTAGRTEDPALFAPVCGPDARQRLGAGDLVRVGITDVRGEALLRQGADRLYFELNTEGTGSLEVSWPGARLNLADADQWVTTTDAPMTLTVRDGGLMRRIAAYCARESGLAVSDWSDQVLAAFRTQLNRTGYEPSHQLLALYRRWLEEGGELTLPLSPHSDTYGVPVREAGTSGDEGLALTYNGAAVPGVYLSPYTPPEESVPQPALAPVVPEEEGRWATAGGWRARPVTSAGQWLGHRVRVRLRSDRIVEGRLVRADERQLEVARAVDGGEVAYPMAVEAVTQFEVWRRGSQPH